MPKRTFKGGAKSRPAKRAKTVDGRQNQRIKKLEKLIYPAIEHKSRDIVGLSVGIPSTGYANQPMFQVEQGDGANQRVGDKVTLKSHHVSMSLASVDLTNTIRIIWIATPSTTAMSIGQVLEYGSYTTHGDLVFSSPYKRVPPSAENTYKVLFDKVYDFKSTQRVLTDKYILRPSKAGKQVNFNSTGSVMPENYQLQLLAISDSTATPNPSISYVCRSRFMDL